MKILVAGDFVPRHRVVAQIDNDDFSCLDEVCPIVEAADYAIVNFESPVVNREVAPMIKTGPNLKCSDKAMACIAYAGFDCVTLANNHFRDYGEAGVEDTLSSCKIHGIDYVGGGKDLSEARSILYKEIGQEKLAIINVCENEWSVATSKQGGACGMDVVDVCHRLKTAHEKADFVLLIIHGGVELYNLPTSEMKKLYRFYAEMGADAIVNHHQHCYSGYEIYQDTPIFYGIGNFCFDKENPDDSWSSGFMVSLDTVSKAFELLPYRQGTKDNAGVCLMNDKDDFVKTIENLNEVIKDDEKLLNEYDKMLSSAKPLWVSLLNPYQGKLLNRLAKWGLIPSFINDQRRNRLYNLVLCESHRGRLLYQLKKELSTE